MADNSLQKRILLILRIRAVYLNLFGIFRVPNRNHVRSNSATKELAGFTLQRQHIHFIYNINWIEIPRIIRSPRQRNH